MEYRFLGDTGLKVSALSYGNYFNIKSEDQQGEQDEIIQVCWENGINYFDTAELYADGKAEILLGNSLKKLNVGRDDIVVSTKLWKQGTSINSQCALNRKHVIEGGLNSLRRLQLDYVDIIFAHRYDIKTPIEETCRAFDWLIRNGKAFYWGTSEWSAEQIFEAYMICDKLGLVRPVVEQPLYHMYSRQKFEVEYSSLFDKYKMGSTTYSPLGGGLLTGKYNNGVPQGSRWDNTNDLLKGRYWNKLMEQNKEQTINQLNALTQIAKEELGAELSNLAIAWVIANKDVSSCIFGASNKQQAQSNASSIHTYKKLTPEILAKIETILSNRPTQPLNNRDMSVLPNRR